MLNQSIIEKIIDAMRNGDEDALSKLTNENEAQLEEPINSFLFRLAVENNIYKYVEENIEKIDLEGGESVLYAYLGETSDERMVEILEEYGRLYEAEEYGGVNDADDYLGCRFACGYLGEILIISFDDDFRKEVFGTYLKKHNMSEEEFIKLYQGNQLECASPAEIELRENIMEDMEQLGICVENEKVVYLDPDEADLHGGIIAEMLTDLGYELNFSGTSSRSQGRVGFEYLY